MSKKACVTVLAATLFSLLAVLSSTASAVTWHNTGDSHFTLTGGAGTLTSTAATLGCTGSTSTGAVTATPFVGATLSVSATVTYSGCTLSGQVLGVECDYRFTGTSWSAGPPAVTTGTTDVTCSWYLASSRICDIEGRAPSHYTNPNGPTPGKFVMTTTTSLTATNGTTGSCLFGSNDRAHQTQLTFNVADATQPFGPVITRTA